MAAILTSVAEPPARRSTRTRLIACAACIALPLSLWLSPLGITANAKGALAISAFMILSWMTEAMEYAATGLVGLLLFWYFGVAKPATIFSGFVNDTSWFYFGAVLMGAMATKSGLPQRLASVIVSRVGLSYSRLLLGLIVVAFLLTFIVPSGVARIVIMAPIVIGVVELFGGGRGSNIGRGMFLVVAYTISVFDKMVIAGGAAITARGLIEGIGGVEVSWGLWLVAFFPCAILTIFASWWLTLRLFPPEVASLDGRADEVREHFRTVSAWTPLATKASLLITLAVVLWLTDRFHHLPASMVAFAVGLAALLPFVDVLDAEDVRRVNLLPFFFVAAALGMGEVLRETGALALLTDAVLGGIEPLLANKMIAVTVLYWGAFAYHFFTASEISMLATSLPVLMEFSKTHHFDPLWIGMVWTFGVGGKLFAYEGAVLVVGYGFGYFRHTDLIKIGALLTIVEFVGLALSATFLWPLIGL